MYCISEIASKFNLYLNLKMETINTYFTTQLCITGCAMVFWKFHVRCVWHMSSRIEVNVIVVIYVLSQRVWQIKRSTQQSP
jgi:hypothetical protein